MKLTLKIQRQRDRVREAVDYRLEKLRGFMPGKPSLIGGMTAYIELSNCHAQLTERMVEQWDLERGITDEDELTQQIIYNVALAIVILEQRQITI